VWSVLKAVFLTIECRGNSNREHAVFLLSDGDIAHEELVVGLVREHCGRPGSKTRVFPIGFGETPHRHNLNTIARVGCGRAEFVLPGESMQDKAARQVKRAT
jgi:hypothetical protein